MPPPNPYPNPTLPTVEQSVGKRGPGQLVRRSLGFTRNVFHVFKMCKLNNSLECLSAQAAALTHLDQGHRSEQLGR